MGHCDVFFLISDSCSCMCSFMVNMCVSSCRWCVLVSVVRPVAIISAVFCVICSLFLMLVVTIWVDYGSCCAFVCGEYSIL